MKGPPLDSPSNEMADDRQTRAGSGTLFVIATPIGNLEDITLRALRILREVALVAAEDTRRSGNLLRHYQIPTPLISLHAHNEHRRQLELVRRLTAGESMALVSDAGTPGISDPGAQLIKAAREAGIRVEPIPGASAVTAVLSASGLALTRFAFAGFPPTGSKDRKLWFEWVAALDDIPVVCFEAPHRIGRTLLDVGRLLVDRPIMVARELTKVHETWLEGSASELMAALPAPRGEFVFILKPRPHVPLGGNTPTDVEIGVTFGQITEMGVDSRREALTGTAHRLGVSTKAVFDALERLKNSAK